MSVKYKCKFQEGLLSDERIKELELNSWNSFNSLNETDPRDHFCKSCQKTFSVAEKGIGRLNLK